MNVLISSTNSKKAGGVFGLLLLFTLLAGCATMRPLHDKPVMLLAIAQSSLAVADYTTTIQSRNRTRAQGAIPIELNPIVRPFAARGAAGLVPVAAFESVSTTWLAYKMHTSPHKWERKLFWVPQAVEIASHVWGLSVTLPSH